MGKTLIVVESPKKAKQISKFLGNDYVVQATVGHVIDLVNSGKSNMGVDLENGFIPRYGVLPDKKDKVKVIIKYAQQADSILLATDPDREGEAISCLLADLLKKTEKPIKRIKFHEITKKAVLAALANPMELDKNLFDAQQARRVIDRIVGFSVSPFLKNKFQEKLSAGRVQSVAVRLVVDKEKEIEQFVPDEYWNIQANFSKDEIPFVAKYLDKVTNEKTAKKIVDQLKSGDFFVKSVVRSEQQEKAAAPFITSSLLAAAASKFKFKAAKTTKAAQELYESGLITYIRTDSVRVSEDAVDSCRNWLISNGYQLPKNPNIFSNKNASQDAHEAIRPTDIDQTPKNVYLPEEQQKIYTLIWEQFVASQMNPIIFDTVNIIIKSSEGPELKASGKTIKSKGWLEIKSKKDNTSILPDLVAKEKLTLINPGIEFEQRFTKPPARFSERTLIEELEKRGIGRPSTYASIMAKISDKNYVDRKGNALIPTDTGKKTVEEITKFFNFINYDYTAQMEDRLDLIADGKLKYVDMMTDFYDPFKLQLRKAYLSNEKDYGYRCDKCGDDVLMVLRHGHYGYYLACINYPKDCKNTISCNVVDDKPVPRPFPTKTIIESVRCPNCQSGMVEIYGKFGPYYSCSEFPICKGKRRMASGKKCPSCQNDLFPTVYKGNGVLFCMGYPKCTYSEDLDDKSISDPRRLTPEIPKKIKKLIK